MSQQYPINYSLQFYKLVSQTIFYMYKQNSVEPLTNRCVQAMSSATSFSRNCRISAIQSHVQVSQIFQVQIYSINRLYIIMCIVQNRNYQYLSVIRGQGQRNSSIRLLEKNLDLSSFHHYQNLTVHRQTLYGQSLCKNRLLMEFFLN